MDRSGNRPKLTDAGRQYLDQIAPAMRQIHGATVALLPASGRSAVRLTLPPSLAVTWLIPQLGAFERENPQIDLQLSTTPRVVNLVREQFDFAIRYGKGNWADVDATFLLDEVAMPVCAPGYLDAIPATPPADALRGSRILVNAHIPDEWEEWARAHQIELPSLGDTIAFDALEQALQVAESGHGIAMGRRPMVDAGLESGRLVAPFGGGEPTGTAYYLCRPQEITPTAAARRLERWLIDLAAS
jgi:LysR family glycine cleavage system transcriptional activator